MDTMENYKSLLEASDLLYSFWFDVEAECYTEFGFHLSPALATLTNARAYINARAWTLFECNCHAVPTENKR